MAFILEIVLTGWIDPFLWFKSMSALYVQKSRKRCIWLFLIYWALLIVKKFMSNSIVNPSIQVVMIITVELYVIFATVFLYEGCFHEKVISVFAFYCILSATELIVIKCYVSLVHMDLDTILQNSMENFTCGILIKILESILCYCFFVSKRVKQFFYCNKERVALTVMAVVMLFGVLSRNSMHEKQSDKILLLDVVWLVFLWNVFSFLITLKKKDNDILDLQQDISRSIERNDLTQDIDRFKHSYSVNMLVMKNLLCNQQYDTFGAYMEETFEDVEKAELLFNHSNITIRILMSGLIQTAW